MKTSDDLLADLRQLHPLLIDLSLDRISQLLAKLGNPQDRLPPVIHIAGTNGKGSTTAYLKAMLEAAGRPVHVYTSPHLVRFNERISLAGRDGKSRPIGEAELVAWLSEVARANAGEPMTFFEITTAAAFQAFAETPADAVILEVGLGGRLDATNVVVKPALTVITPIAIDHAEKLGGSLGLIAAEKAGILKPGCAAIVSQQPEEALLAIKRRARQVGCRLVVWGEQFDTFEQRGRVVFQSEDALLDLPKPALIGAHQIINAGTAVASALELRSLGLNERAIERGLLSVEWPARMQRLGGGALGRLLTPGTELWLDGGHNPAGGRAIAQTLADLEERSSRSLYMIVGMMGQKDIAGFLGAFRGLAKGIIAVPIPGVHERPCSPEDLRATAEGLGFNAESAQDVPCALKRIGALEAGPKRILICGSLYLAGHVLSLQEGIAQQPN